MIIKTIHTQKILSPTQIRIADYVINPYRGCEFECVYCYARENKNLRQSHDTLGVKVNAGEVLEKELRYTKPKRVLLGSTTECFQYQEAHFKVTEQILTILNAYGIPYTILTKSHLISDYLTLISKNKNNKIYFTLNCACSAMMHNLEPNAPALSQRIDALAKIVRCGIDMRVHAGPYLPYVSDIKEIMKMLPVGIKEIDIEMYHHMMGNFDELLKKISMVDPGVAQKIKAVYRDKTAYGKFTHDLKEYLFLLKKTYAYAWYYIVPDYDEFYTSNICYHETL